MLGRTAIVVIPTVAVAVTAMVLLGPGAARPAVGVRLRGAPIEGKTLSFRLEGVRRSYTVEEPMPLDDLRVDAVAGGAQLGTWTGSTGPEGVAEVEIISPAKVTGQLELLITRKGRSLLGQCSIPLRPGASLGPKVGVVPGTVQADQPLLMRVEVSRGILAAPFAEELRVRVGERGDPDRPARAELTLSVLGADLFEGPGTQGAPSSALTLHADERGPARFTVRPLAHQVDLSITARAGEATGKWEGTLPVVPGAIWIDPAQGPTLSLVSPAPHERAYLSFWSDAGRVGGAVVPLVRDAQGFYRGQVTPPAPTGGGPFFATVAGDPLEQGAGTVAWPIEPREGAVLPRPLTLLFDGMAAAEAREQQRAWEARRAGMFVVAAAAIVEVLLLILRNRSAQKTLEAHLVEATAEEMSAEDRGKVLKSGRDYPVLRALVAAAVLGLAFAIIAALGTLR
jgi:hypothetical protein